GRGEAERRDGRGEREEANARHLDLLKEQSVTVSYQFERTTGRGVPPAAFGPLPMAVTPRPSASARLVVLAVGRALLGKNGHLGGRRALLASEEAFDGLAKAG